MYDQITLSNGLRVIGERIPHFRSIAVGLFVGSGSIYETESENGVSHYIEHMLFKGTERRSAMDIASEIDAVGGNMNAYTSKEYTCFYAHVIDEHTHLALDMIADIVRCSLFKPEDIEKERGVILEEIGMVEDQPEDLVSEILMDARLGKQPLARPILGTPDTVSAIDREMLTSYFQRMYSPEKCVLSIAGNYDWDELLKMINELYGTWERGTYTPSPIHTILPAAHIERRAKKMEQLHINIAWPGPSIVDHRRLPMVLFNNLYGSATSSHLFQRIREESGMAYNVASYLSCFDDVGMTCVYAGASRKNAPKVMDMIWEETQNLIHDGITQQEFDMARAQYKGSYILGLEHAASRMMSQGRKLFQFGKVSTESEVLKLLDRITLNEVNASVRDFLTGDCAVALVGDGADTLDVSNFCKSEN